MRRRTLAGLAVALVGLLLAAGLAIAVSTLTSQRIGLSGAPPSVGRGLAAPVPVRRPQAGTPPALTTLVPARPQRDDDHDDDDEHAEEHRADD